MQKLFLLYNCDEHKSYSSMNLIGVTDDIQITKAAVTKLIKNGIIGEEGRDDYSLEIVDSIEGDNDFNSLNDIEYLFVNHTHLNHVEVDGGRL